MLTLIKYEFRKHIVVIAILAAMITCIQGFAIYSIFSGENAFIALSFSLVMFGVFASVIMIFTLGIQSYSKELGSRNSYMMFMTPNSPYKIIGSKLLFTFFVALFATIITVLCFFWDWYLLIEASDKSTWIKMVAHSIDEYFNSFLNMELSQFLMSISVTMILLWLTVFTYICIAYFSITLSATAFSNRKGRGFFSFVIFVVICVILAKISAELPDAQFGTGYIQDLTEPLWSYVLDIAAIAGAVWGTGYLLDKRISL